MQEKIKYKDIMDLGFHEQIVHDQVYLNDYGFDYAIITLNLTKKIYIDWNKVTQLAKMVRIDSPKTCSIMNEMPIMNLDHLKQLVDFFLNRKK
jgi:hypothetical protein